MIHAATIFLSSFLLFLVQPLIARLILPWFGGTAAVWTTCMLFFQMVLLAGYAYAHATNARLAPRSQALVHTVLLAVALALLPIAPHERWKPLGGEEPVTHILVLLVASVGLPYFLLSATSPLLQAWFARARPGQDPYRLFAISNLASVLALVGYPFVVEPYLGNQEQVWVWSVLFALFALLCAGVSWMGSGAGAVQRIEREDAIKAPTRGDYLLWLALSATGSVMLLAVTNHITQNVACDPVAVARPAYPVPAYVHHRVRRTRPVPAGVLVERGGGVDRRDVVAARRYRAPIRSLAASSACTCPASSSPACSATVSVSRAAAGALPDRVLSDRCRPAARSAGCSSRSSRRSSSTAISSLAWDWSRSRCSLPFASPACTSPRGSRASRC
jgi:hypothetical protein